MQLKYVARFVYGDSLPSNGDAREGAFQVFGSNGPFASFSKANTRAPAIVIGRKGSYGKVNWSSEPCFASDTTFLVDSRTTRQNLRWLYYALQTLNLDEGTDEAAVPGLNRDDAYQKEILVPPLSEQHAIADYLDRETAQIDAMIAAKERLLNLAREKRSALITHAVTRGPNQNAPMRDSGVEWLGQIPAHWEVRRLKTLCWSLQTGPFGSQLHAEDYIEGGIPLVNPAHMLNEKILPDDRVTVDEKTAERLAVHRLELGDVVFARRGQLGRCGLVTQREVGWLCGSGSLRARPKREKIDSAFLVLLVANTFVGTSLSIMSVGTTMENLNSEIVGELVVPLPSLSEQRAIVSSVTQETGKLDNLTIAAQQTIALLRERRSALISAAVTGQIQVTE